MRRRPGLLCVIAAVSAGVGCQSATDPIGTDNRPVAVITAIRIPSGFGAGDTVMVKFSYLTAVCDTARAVDVRRDNGALRFTVTSAPWSGACTLSASIGVYDVGYLIPPPHAAGQLLIFSEPGGADSLRILTPATGG